jgi:hypothetical protein
MLKSAYSVAAAFIVASIICLPNLVAKVQAYGPALGVKGDRVDARPLGTACSQNEWPYFEASCLRDARNPFGQARQVRIITTDSLPRTVVTTLLASR